MTTHCRERKRHDANLRKIIITILSFSLLPAPFCSTRNAAAAIITTLAGICILWTIFVKLNIEEIMTVSWGLTLCENVYVL
ncbi:hypothetical protein BJY00DRAFT_13002 [Aspergillus carlsbadensis]|nr:hypothetical protein BJY00DRAFT_13002 [Aspergillus carlsbadensis]